MRRIPIKTVKHGSKKNPWEIDAISGATISSRAVGRCSEQRAGRHAVVEKICERIERGQ